MSRIPQMMLTLSPNGDIVAEYPTPNGLRRHVEITDMDTIRRILSAQLASRPSTIGLDAKPTSAQAKHWQEHLAKNRHDSYCPWCIARELGIDTSEAAYKRAKALLTQQRKAPTARNATPYHYAGDGTIKVYTANKSAKSATRLATQSMIDDLLSDEPDTTDLLQDEA